METCLYLSRVIRRELQAESWDREVVCARVARVSVHVQPSVRVHPPPPTPRFLKHPKPSVESCEVFGLNFCSGWPKTS